MKKQSTGKIVFTLNLCYSIQNTKFKYIVCQKISSYLQKKIKYVNVKTVND